MSEADTNSSKPAREQSTVQFPYADLEEAISVARAIQQSGGVPMERDQIAAKMGQKASSGAFITKLSAARMFGITEPVPGTGKIRITQLGHEAIDTDDGRARAARATAFLNVELYGKLHEEFRGRQLPPRPLGLEQAIVSMGVAPKQRTNARYAFDRSAKQAGFFDHGSDKLVAPVAGPFTPEDKPPRDQQEGVGDVSRPRLDGVITALIDKLPTKGPWEAADRVVWLTMMAMAFDMAYGRKGAISIKETNQGAPNPGRLSEQIGFTSVQRTSPEKEDDEIPF